MKRFLFLPALIAMFVSCSFKPGTIQFRSDFLRLAIDQKGTITELADLRDGANYLADSAPSPLMSVRVNGRIDAPVAVRKGETGETLVLDFDNGLSAEIRVLEQASHISFELFSLSNPDTVELVIWGPYPTNLDKVIGETVGVVQGEKFALGIQSLNPKTLGGYPWNENDCMPQIDIFDQDDLSDMSEQGKRYVLYRVEAAKPESYGSSLQAYCRNRNRERVIANWDHEKYTAPVFHDGGPVGSKIALFGAPVEKALETIGAIELAEGLPHPMIDGEWGKTAASASAAYMIMGFSEMDIDRAIRVTQQAGLRYLYHPGPFETWGHFKLNPKQFPNGVTGLKNCVEKAEKQGIMVGVHTLSNFITPNDPYVTPVPDPRLAKVGSTLLTSDINKSQKEIPIESPDFFNQFKNNHMKTVVVGTELIRYGGVSQEPPWRLLDCRRGAFDTRAAAHAKGDTISKLADHAYRVFLTNPELTIEMSKNIADLYNRTGLRQISFDGLEGNRSTGMGNYGEVLFAQTWYDNLNENIRSHYIADASRTSHFFWHMYTRMNWGEPWYAGFRESQTEYRLKNQAYFKRNLMPAMLGWFRMTAETSVEDIEWMLARSAAFNAGYAFVTGYTDLDKNGDSGRILELLGLWEKARMAGAFTAEQKQRMEDINNEFRLTAAGDKSWELRQIFSYKFKHENKVRQPGEPLYSTFAFNNPAQEQPLWFILTAAGAPVDKITLELDNYKQIQLPVSLSAGDIIRYEGGSTATVYNRFWQERSRIEVNPADFTVKPGDHTLTFDCSFGGGEEAAAKLEIRLPGPVEKITAR